MTRPWPGRARTIYGDHRRFRDTCFSQFSGLYFTGDGCRRTRTATTGSAAASTTSSTSAATGWARRRWRAPWSPSRPWRRPPGYPHDIKGTGIYAYVDLVPEYREWDPEELVGALKEHVRHGRGRGGRSCFRALDILRVAGKSFSSKGSSGRFLEKPDE